MEFLRKLFGAPAASAAPVYTVAVQCARCGETLHARIHLGNELSATEAGGFFCRKVLIGSQRCYQPVEIELTFDAQRQVLDRQITGGRFIDG